MNRRDWLTVGGYLVLLLLVALVLVATGCTPGEPGNGCPHARDVRVNQDVCYHEDANGNRVYHAD